MAVTLATLALAPSAPAKLLKGFWGPTRLNGVSQFGRYNDLRVDVYQMHLAWSSIAATRPSNPRDPHDPAYRWPSDVSYATRQAKHHHIRVLLLIQSSPGWANGGRSSRWAPKHSKDYADFAYAASKKYPGVHLWMVWGEPSRAANFQPLTPQSDSSAHRGERLSKKQARGPRTYARILDAAYGALKSANRKNLVVGGDTFSWGDIRPVQFVKNMRFGRKNRRPRLDLYGHNPFTNRKPNLANGPFCGSRKAGCADFSDLDWFSRIVDRNLGTSHHSHIPLFLSEFTIPTEPNDSEFPYYVSPPTQADWIRAGFRVARAVGAYALGWVHLQDEPPSGSRKTVSGGLLYYNGNKKPGYRAFKKG